LILFDSAVGVQICTVILPSAAQTEPAAAPSTYARNQPARNPTSRRAPQVVKAYVSIYSDARGKATAMTNLKRLEP